MTTGTDNLIYCPNWSVGQNGMCYHLMRRPRLSRHPRSPLRHSLNVNSLFITNPRATSVTSTKRKRRDVLAPFPCAFPRTKRTCRPELCSSLGDRAQITLSSSDYIRCVYCQLVSPKKENIILSRRARWNGERRVRRAAECIAMRRTSMCGFEEKWFYLCECLLRAARMCQRERVRLQQLASH
ncbi:hypothetical protein EVAR_11948_1 [Eumeta japonica]|uniref:Uncharacterized protein n=1 Tax=Eumeta variegata TaxID=151549 RepID=A0A4C1U4X2_EUMVA|nr:hypothetical protein EVAR_11948_1 [Eumeta japonica]